MKKSILYKRLKWQAYWGSRKLLVPWNLYCQQLSDPEQDKISLIDSGEQRRKHGRCRGERQDSRGRC